MLKSNWTPWLIDLLSDKAPLTPNPNENVAKSSYPQRALLNKNATSYLLLTFAFNVTFFSGKNFYTTASAFFKW